MKKILGFLLVLGLVGNICALGDIIEKVQTGVKDLKSDLKNASAALATGDTAKAAENINKADLTLGNASAAVTTVKNKIKDIVPKIKMAKETLMNIHAGTSDVHNTVQQIKEHVKGAVTSYMQNDTQAAQEHAKSALDLLTELLPELENLKAKLSDTHKKTEMLHDAVKEEKGVFSGWF